MGDLFMRLSGQQATRCRDCRHRYFSRASEKEEASPRHRLRRAFRVFHLSTKKKKKLIRMGALALLLFMAVLVLAYYLLSSNSAPNSAPADGSGSLFLPDSAPQADMSGLREVASSFHGDGLRLEPTTSFGRLDIHGGRMAKPECSLL